MRILSLEMEGFRCHGRQVRYDLDGDYVHIIGDNGQGKTTIAEAITYALFGINLAGSPRVDNLIHAGARSMRVTVRFVGQDGLEHEVTRGRRGRSGELYLDGRASTQAEVEQVAGPARYWLPVFWPLTVGGWSDKEAREFFSGLIRRVDPETVLESLGPAHRDVLAAIDLSNPEASAQTIRKQVRETERELERLRGRLEALREQAAEPIPEVTEQDVSAELEQLIAELDALQIPDTSALEVEARRLSEAVARAKAELASLQSQIEDPNDLAGTCPTCGQAIPEDQRALARAAMEQRNAERRARIQEVIAQGREATAKLKRLEQQIAALKAGADARRREELARQIDALRQRQQVYRLQVELRDRALGRRQQVEREIAATEQGIQDGEAALGRYRQELDALRDYAAKHAELQVAQLSQHLRQVSIQLYEVTKTTGEIRPVFRLLYDGRPYQVLSTSERIRVGLEVASLVNRVTGLDYPVFIDGAESITRFDPPAASQVFVATVQADYPLTVAVDREEVVAHG